MDDAGISRKLDLMIAIVRIGFGDELRRARDEALAEPGASQILALCKDWRPAGDLQKAVMKTTRQSSATIKRRVAELVAAGGLERDGAGPTVRYRATGLFEA